MVNFTTLISSLLLVGSVLAIPIIEDIVDVEMTEPIERRGILPPPQPPFLLYMNETNFERGTAIPSRLFAKVFLIEQYASAAYCRINQDSPGDAVTCASNTCDLVQAANATSAIEYNSDLATDVTGFVALDPTNQLIVVAFRGTHSFANWLTNLKFRKVDTKLCPGCTAHRGFWQSWLDSRAAVLDSIKTLAAANPTYQLVVTGHSLGGAIATLATAELRIVHGYKVDLYTYGAPRVAGPELSDFISGQGGNYRVTHTNDIVPTVPGVIMGFVHVSPEYYIAKGNNQPVFGKDITVHEGNKNVDGNAGHMFHAVGPHMWYFNQISACSSFMADP